MQLDVDVSPPANFVILRLGLTHVTLETYDPWPQTLVRWSNETPNHIFDSVTLTFDLDL